MTITRTHRTVSLLLADIIQAGHGLELRLFTINLLLMASGIPFCNAAVIRVPQDRQSISNALSSATAGDTILISDGTYFENGLTITQAVTFRSVNSSALTIVDGGPMGRSLFRVNVPNTGKVMMKGLTFQHFGGGNAIRRVSGGLDVRDCIFQGSVGTPIDARGGENASLDERGKSWIAECVFRGINPLNSYAGVVGCTAIRCIFGGNHGFLTIPIALSDATNCVVYGNMGEFGGGLEDVNPVNCIIWGNVGTQTYRRTTINYSIVEGGYTGIGNLNSDPLFLDGNFHLQPNSPAINSGDPSILDQDGTRSDMGAHGGYFSGPILSLIKAVKPSFMGLVTGTNYQLEVSSDMVTWTNYGSPFAATNTTMPYPQYFDVEDWGMRYFRLVW